MLRPLSSLLGKHNLKLPYEADIFSNNPEVTHQIKCDDFFQAKATISLLKLVCEAKAPPNFTPENLILLGEDDQLLRLNSLDLSSTKVITFANAGHGLILEIPELLAIEIKKIALPETCSNRAE